MGSTWVPELADRLARALYRYPFLKSDLIYLITARSNDINKVYELLHN